MQPNLFTSPASSSSPLWLPHQAKLALFARQMKTIATAMGQNVQELNTDDMLYMQEGRLAPANPVADAAERREAEEKTYTPLTVGPLKRSRKARDRRWSPQVQACFREERGDLTYTFRLERAARGLKEAPNIQRLDLVCSGVKQWGCRARRTVDADAITGELLGMQLSFANFAPSAQIVYCCKSQRDWMAKHGDILMLDTTFNCAPGNMYLSTLLAQMPKPWTNLYRPLAWFIHDHRSADDYSAFIESVQRASNKPKDPRCVLRDFDEAIGKPVRNVWPTALDLGDLFHLLHGKSGAQMSSAKNCAERAATSRQASARSTATTRASSPCPGSWPSSSTSATRSPRVRPPKSGSSTRRSASMRPSSTSCATCPGCRRTTSTPLSASSSAITRTSTAAWSSGIPSSWSARTPRSARRASPSEGRSPPALLRAAHLSAADISTKRPSF